MTDSKMTEEERCQLADFLGSDGYYSNLCAREIAALDKKLEEAESVMGYILRKSDDDWIEDMLRDYFSQSSKEAE